MIGEEIEENLQGLTPFPDISQTKLVIFDVDGTLYDGPKLRKKMLIELVKYYGLKPHKFNELLVLQTFRKEREKLAEDEAENIIKMQYEVCAKKRNVPVDVVKKIVQHWILEFPLKHIAQTQFEGTKKLFKLLQRKGISIAVYSDYPATQKLAKMGLGADLVLSALDPHINRLKPNTTGLQYIIKQFGYAPESCLMIGDRDDRDGAIARKVNMPYQLVLPEPEKIYQQLIQQFSQSQV